MDRTPAELFPQSDQDRYLDMAYTDRWERLKPVIVRLYLGNYGQEGKTTTLNQVVEFMRVNYFFHAAPTEYRSHFRTWKISKRVVKDIKEGVAFALTKQKRPGTSTSHIAVGEGDGKRQLHPNKLTRYLKEQRRIKVITPGLLSSWNLPYEAFIASIHKEVNKQSPYGSLGTTPDHVNIESPIPLTPGREAAEPSPNMQLVYQKARENRTMLFLQDRVEELVVTMCREDRKLLVNYFHDFYIHGFTMAKEWDKRLIRTQSGFTPFPVPQQLNTTGSPMAPSFWIDSPIASTALASPGRLYVSNPPTKLCNWSIHVSPPRGDAYCSTLAEPPQANPLTTSFTDELRHSIVGNSFTNTPAENLPIAQDDVVHVIENDPRALKIDAWKLAIIAGNSQLLVDLCEQNNDEAPEGLDDIHPFHLAASFLDGGHACCSVFEELVYCLGASYAFYHNIDKHNHTILDALTVSILRSHTATRPDSVSRAFRSPKRFPGEEMDICGRWAPDTSKVRKLFRQGHSQIPTSWKHPFCHTAVQAICHCIIAIYGPACAPSINTMSGLFIRRCTECGLELRLRPLHTLVITTFHLASLGMPGETLFGALAVLVCLLNLGADATLSVNISAKEILGDSDSGECSHAHLSPLELMQRVPQNIIDGWSSDLKSGWHCFAQILSRAERHRDSRPKSDSNTHNSELDADECSSENECEFEMEYNGSHPYWMHLKCYDADIGLLWATIQTEFLTYRRIEEGDPWLSEKFSMKALEEWLLGDSAAFQTLLTTNQMMQDHSRCGWFTQAYSQFYPAAQDACSSYFMNMDIYERTTYLQTPELVGVWEGIEPILEEEVSL
ncbi:hypothetical protein HD806DRAFT_492835 [Xylariaceae sp. AK1471]|nr:hypothetical protein HD806DRAFT_492835 [Xylariaceae sp. AK1471]